MNKIETTEQYRELMASAKQNGWRLSNCYFLPRDVEAKVARGNLYSEVLANGLLLIEDEGTFFRCFFYFDRELSGSEWKPAKDAVVEIPFSGAMNEAQQIQVQRVEEMGFRLGRESSMMTLAADSVAESAFRGDDPAGCRTAEPADATQIAELLSNAFNPMYSYLPDREQLREAIDTQRVFVIGSGANVFGALLSTVEKNSATISQVVIHPEHRGKGYGNRLLDHYHRHYAGAVKQYQHWVDINNTGAVAMYKKNGYEFALRKANEYILLTGGSDQ